MNIRKIKKQIKKVDDLRFRKIALQSLNKIRVWSNIDHPNSKSNMRILTKNFYYNGCFK